MANLNLNKAIIAGRLTAEPELKQTPSGVMVLSFTVAVNRKSKTKSGDGQPAQTVADFINCVAWRERAEHIARYFHKGSSICVGGSIQTRSWDDPHGGKRYATEILVDDIWFVDSKNEAQGTSPPASAASAPQEMPPMGVPNFEVLEGDEELPF